MHYVIYPDTLFLENMICNLLFLAFFKSLFFPAATWKKIFWAGGFGALCNTLVSVLFFRCLWILQLGVMFPAAGIMVFSCLNIRDGRRRFFLLYQMTLWVLTLGGVLQMLQQWVQIRAEEMIVSIALFAVIFLTIEKMLKIYKRQNECMREVVLYLDGKSCQIRGYADTGNQLFDPVSKKPVSIISREAWDTLIEKVRPPHYRFIPYKTVGNPGGILQAAQIDYLVILEGSDSVILEKPMIAIAEQPFAGIFHYSILLHNDYC